VVSTFNATTFAHFGTAGTNAPIDYGSGANVSLGATNPDVDGKTNIWPNASGKISIKNRMGSTRTFTVFGLATLA
jgi:hypothetical protein